VLIYFFYQNGFALYGGGVTPAAAERGNLGQIPYSKLSDKYAEGEGVYRATGRVFEMEYWNIKFPSLSCNEVSYYRGEILSDTSFVFTYSEIRGDRGKVIGQRDINQRFVFRRYAPKPDSSSVFVR
jgi:hypothetical protein